MNRTLRKQASVQITLLIILYSPSFAAELENQAKIRLGATIPLSGDFATYGNLIKDGIELARSDLAKKGLDVEIFYEDVNTPGPEAKTAITKLIHKNKIHALAANFLNPSIPIMAAEIERNKLPTFHTAIADDLILEAGEHIFSTNGKIYDEARKLATYAYQEIGAKTASVLYISTTFGDNYAEHFRTAFEALGGKVLLFDTTTIGQKDLRGILSRVKSTNADVFFAAYFGTNMGIVLKQAGNIGIKKPILGVYETEDPSVIQTAGRNAESVKFFVPEPAILTERSRDIRKRFITTYGYEPRILATNAYDATTIISKALAGCYLETKCVLEKIRSIKNYNGASGTFSIDSDRAASREFRLKTIKNAAFVALP